MNSKESDCLPDPQKETTFFFLVKTLRSKTEQPCSNIHTPFFPPSFFSLK
jgi:hypothetical protein